MTKKHIVYISSGVIAIAIIGLVGLNFLRPGAGPIVGGLQIRLEIPNEKASYTYGDTIELHSVVKNMSFSKKSYTSNFSSSVCDGPDILFNNQDIYLSSLCVDLYGSYHVNFDLWPGSELTSDYKLTLRRSDSLEHPEVIQVDFEDGKLQITPGQHQITAKWQGATSNPVTVKVVE